MSKAIHYEIPAEDPARALAFYRDVFGWEATEFGEGSGYWFCRGRTDQNGIDGAIMLRRDPAQPVVNTLQVDSVDEACAAIERAGGTIVVPKMKIPGLGSKAYFRDPEGNIFGVAEVNPLE